jgi:hypothetical protein
MPRKSREEHNRYHREYRAKNPFTPAQKAARRALAQKPEYKARERARHHARIDALASRPRPELCEVCGRPPNGKGTLHLDHCHATKAFRGWLCHGCNTALGWAEDDPSILRKLADYLDRFPRSAEPYQSVKAERRERPLESLPLLDGL